MKKTSLIILLIVLIICSTISCLVGASGIAIFYTVNPKIERQFESNDVYIEETSSKFETLNYVPSDISLNQKNDLLNGFDINFSLSYDTQNNDEYEEYFRNYREIIKLNLENSRRELSEIFQDTPDSRIEITVIDSIAKYEELAGVDWDDNTNFSGLASYTNDIYILMTKGLVVENEVLVGLISHEMVHIFQYAVEPYAYDDYPPNWFVEGMADTLKTGKYTYTNFPRDTFPQSLKELNDSFSANSNNSVALNNSYDISTMFYQHLESKYSRQTMIQIIRDIDDRSFAESFKKNTGVYASDEYINWLNTK